MMTPVNIMDTGKLLFLGILAARLQIILNPPYSHKWVGDSNPLLINDPRFAPAGILAPKSFEDFAFVLHCLSWLSANGTAAIVCWPGIMTRTSNKAEPKIRQYLVDNNYIDCIIQMPENLFFGVSISVCIMILKKNKTENNTLFIDAANEYTKVTNANKLTGENIKRIVQYYVDRKNIDHVCAVVPNTLISNGENAYNLAVNTYVKPKETQAVDIVQIESSISASVQQQMKLRQELDRIISSIEVQ